MALLPPICIATNKSGSNRGFGKKGSNVLKIKIDTGKTPKSTMILTSLLHHRMHEEFCRLGIMVVISQMSFD